MTGAARPSLAVFGAVWFCYFAAIGVFPALVVAVFGLVWAVTLCLPASAKVLEGLGVRSAKPAP